jgi:hypothetical protein
MIVYNVPEADAADAAVRMDLHALTHAQTHTQTHRHTHIVNTHDNVPEVDAADAAVRMDLHAQRLNVVRAVCAAREVREVELNLVPALIQTHRHGADERCIALQKSARVLVCERRSTKTVRTYA